MSYLPTELTKRVGIVAANHPGYVEALFSCLEAGDIAVPLRQADDQGRINAANIGHIITPTENGAWLQRQFTAVNSREPALISFTSGTEGMPKGVILTHTNLADVITRLNSAMQLDDSISEYVGVPVYQSFGFGRCRAVATVGGKCFIPKHGFNPAEIGKMLRQGEINAISAVPSLWRVLLANKDLIANYGRAVRWIEIGSQYMSRLEKEEMKTLFPEARILQHYGLTEASRTTLLAIHAVEGHCLESVGQASAGVEVKQTPAGRIAIRGHHTALNYLIDGQAVALQDEEGWFESQDLGRLENGYLYYHGRADDVINCGGIKIHPEALETKIYAKIGGCSGLAICRKPDLMRGEGFLVAVTPELKVDQQQLQKTILQATGELGVNAGNAITIIDIAVLPTTATGKIQRKQLAAWYTQQSAEATLSVNSQNQMAVDSTPIRAIFDRILNASRKGEILPHESFISLGGDSLSYIQFAMELEGYLGRLPNRWEYMTWRELEALAPQRSRNTTIETDVLLRAVAILAIIFNHTSQLLVPEKNIVGASLVLLLLTGFNFARFQGNSLFKAKLGRAIAPILGNLLIPYLAINLLYQVWSKHVDFSVLLLVNNFINPLATEVSAEPFPYWFICILVQIIIGFSILSRIKQLRDTANSSLWLFGIILLVMGAGVNLLSIHLWYSNESFYPRLPYILFWIFALGWCLHFAKSKFEKLVTTVILLLVIAVTFMGGVTAEKFWILISGIILLWIPTIPVPLVVKSVARTIGAATFYIYILHVFLIWLMHKIGIYDPLVEITVALMGSLLVYFLSQGLRQLWLESRWLTKERALNKL